MPDPAGQIQRRILKVRITSLRERLENRPDRGPTQGPVSYVATSGYRNPGDWLGGGDQALLPTTEWRSSRRRATNRLRKASEGGATARHRSPEE
jgi:hypothetical protein